MKVNNNALQELYDTLVNCTISFSPYGESPVAKAFRECDEKLQNDIDIWRRSNDFLRSAITDRVSNERKLEKERDDLLIRVHHTEDEAEELKKECKTLRDRNDILEKSNRTLLSPNIDLCSNNRDLKNWIEQLEKDLDEAKSSVKYYGNSRDDWRSRAKHAEEEVEELKESLEKANTDRTELQNDRDFYHGLYTELRKDYDKFFEENKRLSEQIKNLKKFNSEITSKSVDIATYEMLNAKYRELLRRSGGKEEGEENLWSMLQMVRDVKPEEFDCECETLGDINAWESTFEATIEVNKDLLEKVCGVKPEEEEHKLEYGDAVRLSWCDYDYMYIGPDNEEETVVRMFDPKNHAIATSHIGNVRYSGCKIIICDEDDLRKIWKDKK